MNTFSSQILNRIIIYSSLFWLVIVGISCFWNYSKMKTQQKEISLQTARSFFEQILVTREWSAKHGGVYVPITETTQPNPYLKDPLRDLPINKNLKLTKINPSYMTRQLSEISSLDKNIQFHITSLDPIRPENIATQREREALLSFEKGFKDTGQILASGKEKTFFYMAPLITRKSCLNCHTNKLGTIRGGISITLPQIPVLSFTPLFLGHFLISLIGFIGIFIFWTKLNSAYGIMKKQAVIDSLTNIPNRRSFSEKILEEFNRSRRNMEPLTVLMCDIDNFKEYNDTYGHKEGDECLIKVAQTINSSIRRPSDFCARYGGEEFIVILPETDIDGALPVAKNILSNIRKSYIEHSTESPLRRVTISIGAATTTATTDTSYEDLVKNADTALYWAKKRGKNRVEQMKTEL